MAENSVKVAVRVRPFNQREMDRKATLVVKMQGAMTIISNPDITQNEEPKKFTFDHSYWSHDGFVANEEGILEPEAGSIYASQRMVFEDLGQGVLNNAFGGYNCSLFAYGQTGAGKSYSMVGYGPNKGIVPITCDELFKTINENTDEGRRFEVSFSMLEIYNEQVRDLLSKENPKGGLPVRQNPKQGYFYVQGLKQVAVGSYKEIENRMEQGTANRTVASTNMNATSSRAHTVVTITFDQITKNAASSETKKSSTMNLVDLAGSERADSTGATGDRLKEGANINKSLSALGNVISALADVSMGKKKVMVPYRDSVLTKLLQNALGGNSKTIMIAALSPADINYDETLGTLRYADRAKKIKCKAVVNENPMDKLIRELREENERLKKAMEAGTFNIQPQAGAPDGGRALTDAEMNKMRKEMEDEIRAQLLANQELINKQGQTWEEKLEEARNENMTPAGGRDTNRKQKEPHLVNLNEDPMLSGVIYHFLPEGEIMIGRRDHKNEPEICLSGISIMQKHAVITNSGGEVEMRPAGAGAKTKINGAPLTGPRVLGHKDRVLFGSNHLYVFLNPLKDDSDGLPDEITWEFAQKEIAQAKGFATGMAAGLSKDQQIAQEQILEILPLVSEVNAISEELNKRRTFEVVLISAAAQEGGYNSQKGTKVMVKMKNLLNGNSWLWERGKFMNRRYLMQDMYQRWLDGDEDIMDIPQEEDPFWEPAEDICIGTANVFLQSLAYALDFDDQLAITDFKGQEEGAIYVNVTPCTHAGQPLDEDYFVDKPSELLGKPYYFKVTIRHAKIQKARYSKGIKVCYKVYKEEEFVETDIVEGTLEPHFNHSRIVHFASITQDHLDFFESGYITLSVYGMQEDTLPDSKLLKMTTRELRQMDNMQKPSINNRNTAFAVDLNNDQSQLKADFLLLQRKYERLEQKERRMQQLCQEWDSKPVPDKKFDPFYRAISAVAFSTGTRLKTTANVLKSVIGGHKFVRNMQRLQSNNSDTKTETISLYYYGEDEDQLANEAQRNGGVLDSDIVTNHAALKDQTEHVLQMKKFTGNANGDFHQQTQVNGNGVAKGSPGKISANGKDSEGSKACAVM